MLAGARVRKTQLRRVQKLAAKSANLLLRVRFANRILAPAAVSRVAHYRVADMRQVDAYLMRSARLDHHLDEREFVVSVLDLKDRMGRATRASAQDRHASAVMRASAYARLDLAARLRHATVNERDIHLEDLPVTELVR
jgi:hypothetical protein